MSTTCSKLFGFGRFRKYYFRKFGNTFCKSYCFYLFLYSERMSHSRKSDKITSDFREKFRHFNFKISSKLRIQMAASADNMIF